MLSTVMPRLHNLMTKCCVGAHHGGNENAVQGNVAACREESRQQRGLPGSVVQPALECRSNGLPCLQVSYIVKLRLCSAGAAMDKCYACKVDRIWLLPA